MCWRDLWAVPPLQCLCVCAWVWHMWRYPIAFPIRLARAVSKGKPIMVQALKASTEQTNFQKLRVKMPHKLCNIFESEATPAWGRACLQGMWQMRKGNVEKGSAARAQHGSNCKRRKEHHGKWKFCNRTILQLPGKCKNRRDTLDGKCFRGKLCTLSGWRVAANGMQREEKQTARYFCTISQWPRQLWGACVCVYWSIDVCVCAHHVRRLTIDWVVVVAWRRRKLRVVNSWPHTENVRANECACVCVCVFCLLFYMNFRSKTKRRQQQRTSERGREWEIERVRKLRQLLGALQPEVDFRVEFFAPFQCFHCNWSGLFYWVSSWNRAKPKPKAEEPHTPSFLTRYR